MGGLHIGLSSRYLCYWSRMVPVFSVSNKKDHNGSVQERVLGFHNDLIRDDIYVSEFISYLLLKEIEKSFVSLSCPD